MQAMLRGLGICDKISTGPLMRAVEDPKKHIFEHNKMWQQVLTNLEELSKDAKPLLKADCNVVPNIAIKKDDVFDDLFTNPDEELTEEDELTEEFLRLQCCSFTVLLARQLEDQFAGGKYAEVSDRVLLSDGSQLHFAHR